MLTAAPAVAMSQGQLGGMNERQLESGVKMYTLPADIPTNMFRVVGSDYSQIVEITLAPGQVVSFEPGTMIFLDDGIEPGVDVGDCSQACTRCCCLGESIFRLNLHNTTNEPRRVALSPAHPARVVPVNMNVYHQGLYVSSHAFLGAFGTAWRVRPKMVRSIGAALFGGQGWFLNLVVSDSWVVRSSQDGWKGRLTLCAARNSSWPPAAPCLRKRCAMARFWCASRTLFWPLSRRAISAFAAYAGA